MKIRLNVDDCSVVPAPRPSAARPDSRFSPVVAVQQSCAQPAALYLAAPPLWSNLRAAGVYGFFILPMSSTMRGHPAMNNPAPRRRASSGGGVQP
ncbi:Uncharacterized protein ChrSV_0657 [Chromobacterium vaccinii]|nr:Uncharacterized protein ChrSW_0657 [Chromobacterium vaccinii]QND88116.1 Uncharacterized protein ChrSV_0657 [Chromobacterium vaccinii]